MVSFVMLFGEVLYKWVSGMSPMAKPASKSKFVFDHLNISSQTPF
jgi:hypothetical protein